MGHLCAKVGQVMVRDARSTFCAKMTTAMISFSRIRDRIDSVSSEPVLFAIFSKN